MRRQFGTSRLLLSFKRVILGRAVTGTATQIDLCADSVVRLIKLFPEFLISSINCPRFEFDDGRSFFIRIRDD